MDLDIDSGPFFDFKKLINEQ